MERVGKVLLPVDVANGAIKRLSIRDLGDAPRNA
jgi:hypothetical protein